MMAAVVAIDAPRLDPNDRERRVRATHYDASQALTKGLRHLGLLTGQDPCTSSTGIGLLLHVHDQAASAYRTHFENRAQKAERVLRALLASDTLTADQRERVFNILTGEKVGRDPKMLTKSEKQIIENYRAMDIPSKQVIRTLSAKLTKTEGD